MLAGYVKTESWDCGGQDLESYPVDWRSEDDKVMCAARCAALPQCVSFNFGRSDAATAVCYLKTGFQSPPNCGAVSDHWDYYHKVIYVEE